MEGNPLNILALEPYFGGARRLMLETLIKHSRHHYTLLRLPCRRLERRLETSARWFAEVLNRRPPERFDLLFTSETINLVELYQLCPALRKIPAVAYFHDNQLPLPGQGSGGPLDHVNLVTAMEAREIWFNSEHHLRTFRGRVRALAQQVAGFGSGGAVSRVTDKAVVAPPPVEWPGDEAALAIRMTRASRTIFVDLREADLGLLNDALGELQRRGEAFEIVAVGSRSDLPARVRATMLSEQNEPAATHAMAKCDTYLSTQTDASFDPRLIIAMATGMNVLTPDVAAYPELIPPRLHGLSLYQPRFDFLASALQDLWALPGVTDWETEHTSELNRFEAASATRQMDWRFSTIAQTQHPTTG